MKKCFNPKISIIIPVYNVRTYISECLESVKKAVERISVEVLLIDDDSTDGSSTIAKEFAEKESNFVYYHKKNGGPGETRNYGIERAIGEYLAFVDADDVVDENHFTSMLAVIQKHNCDMVISDVKRITDDKYTYSSLHRKAHYNTRDLKISMEKNPTLIFDATVYNRLVRKELVDKNGIRFPEGYRYEDYPFVQELDYYSKTIRFVRNWGYAWRIRTDGTRSITKSHTDTINLTDKIYTLELVRSFAKNHRVSRDYMRLLDYKILSVEFNGTILALKDLTEEKALDHLNIASEYIEDNIDLSVLDYLPVYDIQKIDWILKRNLDKIKKLLEYRANNYNNAAVKRINDSYEMQLPGDIFPIPNRSMKNEYASVPFAHAIDDLKIGNSHIDIHGHIYARRIPVPDLDSQKVLTYLVNNAEDGELELETTCELCSKLTEVRGDVVSLDDNKTYHYNYDGAGYKIRLDLEAITTDKRFRGTNYILADYTNPIGHSTQLLKGASKAIKKELRNGIKTDFNGCHIVIGVNDIDMLTITVEEYYIDNIELDNNSLSFYFSDPLIIRKPTLETSSGLSVEIEEFDVQNGVFKKVIDDIEDGEYYLKCLCSDGKKVPFKMENNCKKNIKLGKRRRCRVCGDHQGVCLIVESVEKKFFTLKKD